MNPYFLQCRLLVFTTGFRPELAAFLAHTHVEAFPSNSAADINAGFESAFNAGYRKVVALLSCPGTLDENHLQEAFLSLRIMDCCLGPESGRGIYLFGMNALKPGLLESFDWQAANSARMLTRKIGERKEVMYRLPEL